MESATSSSMRYVPLPPSLPPCAFSFCQATLTDPPFLPPSLPPSLPQVHERSLESDFLLIILRDVLPSRPDLKVRKGGRKEGREGGEGGREGGRVAGVEMLEGRCVYTLTFPPSLPPSLPPSGHPHVRHDEQSHVRLLLHLLYLPPRLADARVRREGGREGGREGERGGKSRSIHFV